MISIIEKLYRLFIILLTVYLISCTSPVKIEKRAADDPIVPYSGEKLPIGMNINGLNYYTTGIIFTDAMTTASEPITYVAGGSWDSGVNDEIDFDTDGYPTSIPQTTSAGYLFNLNFKENPNSISIAGIPIMT